MKGGQAVGKVCWVDSQIFSGAHCRLLKAQIPLVSESQCFLDCQKLVLLLERCRKRGADLEARNFFCVVPPSMLFAAFD